jgi:hypothetical protein
MNSIHDPANYQAMSVPFENHEQANAAINAFIADVRAARQKHHIADCTFVIAVPVGYPEGEGTGCMFGHIGDVANAEMMLAHALGQLQRDRRERVEKVMRGEKP